MLAGRKPKDDDRKVNHVALTHDWINVPNVPYEPTADQRALLAPRPSKAVQAWWAIVSTMPHCGLWEPGMWQFAKETAVLYGTFIASRGTKQATELRDRERRLAMTVEGLRDFRIRYVPVQPEAVAEHPERVSDFEAERMRRLLEAEADAP